MELKDCVRRILRNDFQRRELAIVIQFRVEGFSANGSKVRENCEKPTLVREDWVGPTYGVLISMPIAAQVVASLVAQIYEPVVFLPGCPFSFKCHSGILSQTKTKFLKSDITIKEGDLVKRIGSIMDISARKVMLERMVGALEAPIDGRGAFNDHE
ncbi:ATPase subunit 1 [Cucumis melo var. makuwa]|uniref:ATPase subunit 1 (Mitochondrion) n=1 Tax=Cucumis melo var. makuwa TaxID=1194695 RepID=A0A5D3BBV6_CUCMM|nr:ATPase subunit 1 [Cucumis melo var. makuwa]